MSQSFRVHCASVHHTYKSGCVPMAVVLFLSTLLKKRSWLLLNARQFFTQSGGWKSSFFSMMEKVDFIPAFCSGPALLTKRQSSTDLSQ